MKKFINLSMVYAVLAMIGGVFYREFTKFNAFTGITTLSLVHVHYMVLGVLFFIVLLLLEKNFSFMNSFANKVLISYQVGLNLTVVMFVVRGICQVLDVTLSSASNAMISGFAGIGHIILGVSLVMILLQVRRSVINLKN